MTEYKKKQLEMRRIINSIEVRRAKRDEFVAGWLKIVTIMIGIVALVAASFVIVRDAKLKADEEYLKANALHELRVLKEKAADRVTKNKDDGMAKFAYVVASAILNSKGV